MLNRKGRKRKSGRRTSNGQLVRKPVDYRSMAEQWPHRIGLPAALRSHERAESEIGRLNLANRISEQEYEAGRRYSVIVGAYLSMANAPRGMAGQGRGYDCVGAMDCPVDTCICLARTQRFQRAYEAIGDLGWKVAHRAHKAINRVVIQDFVCFADEVEALKLGLSVLARHFGLTNQQR